MSATLPGGHCLAHLGLLYLAHWGPMCLAQGGYCIWHTVAIVSGTLVVTVAAQGSYRIWHRIVHFEPDIEKVFLELFQPMRLSRAQFRKLVRHS